MFDAFGHTFDHRINRLKKVKSIWGMLLTVILAVAVLLYFVQKVSIMAARSQANVAQIIEESFYDETHEFGIEQGFYIAVSVGPLEPEIGSF